LKRVAVCCSVLGSQMLSTSGRSGKRIVDL